MIRTLSLIILAFIVNRMYAQNLLSNGSFEQGNISWNHLAGDGSAATYSLSTIEKYAGAQSLQAVINRLGTNAWSVQSIHSGWTATPGKTYRLTFYAKSNNPAFILRQLFNNPYSTNQATLSTAWRLYDFLYTPTQASPGFLFHYASTGTVWIDNISISEVANTGSFPEAPANSSLRALAAQCGLNIGSTVNPNPLANEAVYANTLKKEFNTVVCENAMKMFAIKPTEFGPYNFTEARQVVNFARANGMKVRGHAILWHNGLPDWVKNKAWTKATLLAFLKSYIERMGQEFRGEIFEWDVANEFIQDGNGHILRSGTQSVWMRYIGEEALDSAFKWMRQAFPGSKLFYNDYSTEGINGKSDAVYNLVRRLKNRNVPIDGVGMQCHMDYNELLFRPSTLATQIDQNIKRLGALGLEVAITELDMGIVLPLAPEKYQQQAQSYANLLAIALENPTIVKTFMIWGFTDKYTWIPAHTAVFGPPKDDPLLYTRSYTRKPAYHALSYILSNNCQGNTGPVVSFIRPANAQTYAAPANVTVQVSAQDSDGVSEVELFINNVSVRKEITAPYDWNHQGQDVALQNLAAGSYELKAVAKDALGNTSQAIVRVAVQASDPCANATPPSVSLSAPANNSTFNLGATVTLQAAASSGSGISNVEFWEGTTLLFRDTQAPFTYASSTFTEGVHTVTAKLNDACQRSATSTSVRFTMTPILTSGDPIIGPHCGSPGQTLSFQVGQTGLSNVSGYSWWLSGTSGQVTPSANKQSCTVVLSNYFKTGEVCLGVNLQAAPYYKQFCKALSACATRSGEEEMIDATTIIYPNPVLKGTSCYINTGAFPSGEASIKIVNAQGTTVTEQRYAQLPSSISVNELRQGQYQMIISVGDVHFRQSLVVE